MSSSDNVNFIRRIAKASPAERQNLLLNASNKNLKALSEICLNLIRGNIKLNSKTKAKFRRHKKPIELLANRKISLKRKKQIINQKGSGAFLIPLASLATGLLSNIVSSSLSRILKK